MVHSPITNTPNALFVSVTRVTLFISAALITGMLYMDLIRGTGMFIPMDGMRMLSQPSVTAYGGIGDMVRSDSVGDGIVGIPVITAVGIIPVITADGMVATGDIIITTIITGDITTIGVADGTDLTMQVVITPTEYRQDREYLHVRLIQADKV